MIYSLLKWGNLFSDAMHWGGVQKNSQRVSAREQLGRGRFQMLIKGKDFLEIVDVKFTMLLNYLSLCVPMHEID